MRDFTFVHQVHLSSPQRTAFTKLQLHSCTRALVHRWLRAAEARVHSHLSCLNSSLSRQSQGSSLVSPPRPAPGPLRGPCARSRGPRCTGCGSAGGGGAPPAAARKGLASRSVGLCQNDSFALVMGHVSACLRRENPAPSDSVPDVATHSAPSGLRQTTARPCPRSP